MLNVKIVDGDARAWDMLTAECHKLKDEIAAVTAERNRYRDALAEKAAREMLDVE